MALFPTAEALVLRADAGPKIGFGHVSRLLGLGAAWTRAGGRAVLLTHRPSDAVRESAAAAGVPVRDVPARFPDPRDAESLRAEASRHETAPWIAVDGYAFDDRYLEQARAGGARVLAVDDTLSLPRYPVDVVLNQNAGADGRDYPLEDASLPLLGPRWALLRGEFQEAPGAAATPSSGAPRILVSFGGADDADATGRAVEALKRVAKPFSATVLVGPDNPRLDALRAAASGTPISVERGGDVARLMKASRLAVIAGGVTMLECCATGLAPIVLTVADNQEPGARSLSEAGAVRLLGRARDVAAEDLAREIERLLEDAPARAALARQGRQACDGRGAERVTRALRALSARVLDGRHVTLRPAEPADAREVHRIANDPAVRRHSFDPRPIPWESHLKWFQARLQDPDDRIFVADAGAVAGQVRLTRVAPGVLEVHFSVHPAFRGRKLGAWLLEQARALAFAQPGITEVLGLVKPDNPASIKSFEAGGYAPDGRHAHAGQDCLRFRAGRAA